METTEQKILAKLKKAGRGKVFFPDYFAGIASSDSIRKSLELLTTKGEIIRVARGIYCYPKIDEELGLGVLYPSVDEIVGAIAKRDHMKVVPTGVHALRVSHQWMVTTNHSAQQHNRKAKTDCSQKPGVQ